MSRHHEASRHTTALPKVKAYLRSQLPMPCVECGRDVADDMAWQVGHITPASAGGLTTIDNCGPVHTRCNLRAGGKLGAAVSNQSRRAGRDIRPW